jgi:hypothetical protein
MRITIDLDLEKVVIAPGTTALLNTLAMKRATLAVLEVQFTRGFTVVELPDDATGKFELKDPLLYDDGALTGASSWFKVGGGTDTYYLFAFAIAGAPALDTRFGVDTATIVFTVNSSTDLFTSTAHGLVAGNTVRVTSTTTLPAPLVASTTYYVIAAGLTTDAFKLSTTLGGSAIDLTDTGTGTHHWGRPVPDVAQLDLMGEVSWRYDARDRKSQTLDVTLDNDVNRDADTIPDSPAIVYVRDSIVRFGAGVPSDSLGLDGDCYVNDTVGSGYFDFYVRASGVYTLIGNIKGAGYAASSTTSLAIGTGSKAFTTAAGLAYSAGARVRTSSAADPTNFMEGVVASYSGTTLTVTVDLIGGTGTHTDWNINLAFGTNGAGYYATSATSFAIGGGSDAFTTQAGLAYTAGARVRASSAANPANYMEGVVTAYSGTTLTVTIDHVGGSGTHTDWNLNLAGDVGATGADGINLGTIAQLAYSQTDQTASAETSHMARSVPANGFLAGNIAAIRFRFWGLITNGSTAITFTPRLRWNHWPADRGHDHGAEQHALVDGSVDDVRRKRGHSDRTHRNDDHQSHRGRRRAGET